MPSKNGKSKPFKKSDSLWGSIIKRKSSSMDETMMALKRTALFAEMKNSELIEFQRLIRQRFFKQNEAIFWQGEPGVALYIIKKGMVGIYNIKADRSKDQLAELRAGDFFGELALLDESPRSATCISIEKSEIIALFRHDLFNLLGRKPRLGNKFLFQLATLIGEKLKNTNQELYKIKAKLEQSDILV